ncbi:Transcription factor BIM2 [Musa troglodytarum]|uniref:Transcription factor BIM2 n=1 Tax=Musa troglodytarum TaxID=320322 RepID=A0A9E7KSE7_9LILI|nr:Transcription factor BIM2 [Musa troglodytarum]
MKGGYVKARAEEEFTEARRFKISKESPLASPPRGANFSVGNHQIDLIVRSSRSAALNAIGSLGFRFLERKSWAQFYSFCDELLRISCKRSKRDGGPSSKIHGLPHKTRDFLQPPERGKEEDAVPVERPAEQARPGEVGTYAIGHAAGAVKPEGRGCSDAPRFPAGLETKPEPEYGGRTTTSASYRHAGGASYTPWDDNDTESGGQRTSHFAAAGECHDSGPIPATVAIAAATTGRQDSTPEKKHLTEAATSRSSRAYDGVEDEDFAKREGSSTSKDLAIKVDGKASCVNQRPNNPRSKHSATEQRRRSKINDRQVTEKFIYFPRLVCLYLEHKILCRFQILRELIPHSDQKRDKASFLMEVIEYVRFLQEKIQKYESSPPGWNKDNAKLIHWNNSQVPPNGLSVPPHVVKNDSAPPAHVFSKQLDDSRVPVVPPSPLSLHNPPAAGHTAGVFYKTNGNLAATQNLLQPRLFPVGRETSISQSQQRLADAGNMASHNRSPCVRTCSLADCSVSKQMLNEQEELTIDEGTISVSTVYSHGLLNRLTEALQSSGIDLSQANISVQFQFGKPPINKRPDAATATTSTIKVCALWIQKILHHVINQLVTAGWGSVARNHHEHPKDTEFVASTAFVGHYTLILS